MQTKNTWGWCVGGREVDICKGWNCWLTLAWVIGCWGGSAWVSILGANWLRFCAWPCPSCPSRDMLCPGGIFYRWKRKRKRERSGQVMAGLPIWPLCLETCISCYWFQNNSYFPDSKQSKPRRAGGCSSLNHCYCFHYCLHYLSVGSCPRKLLFIELFIFSPFNCCSRNTAASNSAAPNQTQVP